ncbi:MAG: glycosyltransferase family 2 protein [Methanosarcina flavescens]|jgi:glycosyltransferase involved in cell wall biosynthesis|uniref:Glycosyltransferase family 2 protein n=1 Tax=Methanosarcina flavescens TaxID=1715806 RepID=A0A660HQQ3_9EURY|nr:glycosyltransferase family 2 protein [Methanosarcina flavescens]AYK14396.1 glycosyltransferase family 2 protein [Methanosarcina flavescens]NLK32564.1 glycosyltransferase family 2 protein [Methanosarcina flavescens]
MSKTPLVSIILPTYNRASVLGVCIESILNQSYTNWELLISDDCSTDKTVEVIKDYMIRDPRITGMSHEHNLGLPRNRNTALFAAKGQLVFFIEDDLVLHLNCLEELVSTYNSFDTHNIVIVPRLIENTNPDKEAVKRDVPFYVNKFTGEIFNNYGQDSGNVIEVEMGHACCLYPAKQLQSIGGYEEKAYKGTYCREESDLNMRLINKGFKFYFQPAAVADHNKVSTGGCRLSGRLRQTYFYARNHIIFLLRNFGIKSTYMIPCFLIVLSRRILINNLFSKSS